MAKYLKVFVMFVMLFGLLASGTGAVFADGERITGTLDRITKNVNGPLGQLYELDFILVGDDRMFATRQYANWEKNFMVFAQHGDRVTFEVRYTSSNGFVVVKDFDYAPAPPPLQSTPASPAARQTKMVPQANKKRPVRTSQQHTGHGAHALTKTQKK
jgi:hypothetical protein